MRVGALIAAVLLPAWAGAEEATQGAQSEAEPARMEYFVRSGATWVADPAFALVSDSRQLSRFELGLGYLPGWLDDRFHLQIGYGYGSTEAYVLDAADTSLVVHSILGSAFYNLTKAQIGRAFVRAGAEVVFATLYVDEIHEYSQTETLLGLQGLFGYELNLPFQTGGSGYGPRLNFYLETGYEFFPFAARFDDLRRSGLDGVKPTPISSTGTNVGEMKLSGLMLRFGFALWF